MNSDQAAYESPLRLRYAACAFAAAVLIVASQLVQLSGTHTSTSELTLTLITINKRFPLDLVGAVVDSIGLLTLAVLLRWINQISAARNPAFRSFIGKIVIGGAVVSSICAIVYWVGLSSKAHDFVTSGTQSYPQARHLMSGWGVVAPQILGELGSLLLTAGIIWISLNAMRVGLLTRLVGYVGVFAGALVLFPIGALVPIVQGFWLAAVAVIIAGRWPSGDPPAWQSGIAIPWPPGAGAQRQAAARQQRPPRGARGKGRGQGAPAPTPAVIEIGETDPIRSRANTPKRKRKRRN
jgi:hypothetical protein